MLLFFLLFSLSRSLVFVGSNIFSDVFLAKIFVLTLFPLAATQRALNIDCCYILNLAPFYVKYIEHSLNIILSIFFIRFAFCLSFSLFAQPFPLLSRSLSLTSYIYSTWIYIYIRVLIYIAYTKFICAHVYYARVDLVSDRTLWLIEYERFWALSSCGFRCSIWL